MGARPGMEKKGILESWKEISDYLNRSVKTCQRWEEEFGLPVHRLEETPKSPGLCRIRRARRLDQGEASSRGRL